MYSSCPSIDSETQCWPAEQRQAPSCSHSFHFLLTGRQEEDSFLQQAEARETRRQYEHSCKVHTHCVRRLVFACGCAVSLRSLTFPLCAFVQTLEDLTDSYRTHSTDLAKTVSQYSHTQEEVRQIRYMCERVCVVGYCFSSHML